MSWKVDEVQRYYYLSGRNAKTYEEVTFWVNDKMERKETKRTESIYDGEEYKLPDWARPITTRNRNLESDRVY